ncbi:MAG TPA: hypothetical protein PKE45_00365 [Caldilineaceae bacterium]|nr:hypothetical protein [Caldilineaceae bacterium]
MMTAWLVQGLSYAQGNDHWLTILTRLSALGSWLGFDQLNSALLNSPLFRPQRQSLTEMGAPPLSTLEEPQELGAVHNWTAEITKLHELAAAHHRLMPETMAQPPGSGAHYWLISSSYRG